MSKMAGFFWITEINSKAGYSLMAGYSQLAGNQWKSWMLPNGWKLSNGWKFLNGWKLLERLDDDKWLEISRKAGYC